MEYTNSLITPMTMTYELITPEKARRFLANNHHNRPVSKKLVAAYATDMLNANWTSETASAIAIDEYGELRDGQHRLEAIIQANRPVYMWVCRGVGDDGIYDSNRPRSISDQIKITQPELPTCFHSNSNLGVIRFFIHRGDNRRVTTGEISDFITRNYDRLYSFFSEISTTHYQRTSKATVRAALLTAYCAGVSTEVINRFYTVLGTGLSESENEFPIIAYRNYLLNSDRDRVNAEEIKRAQYALFKYITKSKTRKSISPVNPIYPIFPEEFYNDKKED